MPLAADLRPKTLKEFIGQEKLVGKNGPLKALISSGNIPSMIFWGPPGSGKTTLAEIISHTIAADFLKISAVIDGKDALKKVITKAELNQAHGKQTILFIDEIHRWSKAQQDALLPFVESGQVVLIGATTENPSFTVISPLLSRCRVFVFSQHKETDILVAISRGLEALQLDMEKEPREKLAAISNGDIRFALNTLEIAANLTRAQAGKKTETKKKLRMIADATIDQAAQKFLRYDRQGEEHYNLISAVHKSLRSSNATAAVYWLMRMLEGGEDPLYIARRLVRFASEDIGNANPNALLLANIVYDTCHKLGMPECDTALVQLAKYLADSKKDNSAYVAAGLAKRDIKTYGNLPVPLHFRNAPTQLMKDLGYGKNYQYDHSLESKKSDQECLPPEIKDHNYFNSLLQ